MSLTIAGIEYFFFKPTSTVKKSGKVSLVVSLLSDDLWPGLWLPTIQLQEIVCVPDTLPPLLYLHTHTHIFSHSHRCPWCEMWEWKSNASSTRAGYTSTRSVSTNQKTAPPFTRRCSPTRPAKSMSFSRDLPPISSQMIAAGRWYHAYNTAFHTPTCTQKLCNCLVQFRMAWSVNPQHQARHQIHQVTLLLSQKLRTLPNNFHTEQEVPFPLSRSLNKTRALRNPRHYSLLFQKDRTWRDANFSTRIWWRFSVAPGRSCWFGCSGMVSLCQL